MNGMRFKFLVGDMNWQQYGGTFISRRLNNGDWDYWLVMDVINWEDSTSEEEAKENGRYLVEISAVSPEAAGAEKLLDAMRAVGQEEDDPTQYTDEQKVELLSTSGIKARLWYEQGNNLRQIMARGRQEAVAIESMFGFYMDQVINRIGNTGWDFIAGDLGFH